jgi:hypothetical protein
VRKLEQLRERLNGWDLVAEDPEPLLSTGLCSGEWFDSALPALRETAARCDLSGQALVHLDVRSDNLCFRDDRVLLVDWNLACVGNPLVDVVGWLPSLRVEGGPEPWAILPDSGGVAALLASYFASRAVEGAIIDVTVQAAARYSWMRPAEAVTAVDRPAGRGLAAAPRLRRTQVERCGLSRSQKSTRINRARSRQPGRLPPSSTQPTDHGAFMEPRGCNRRQSVANRIRRGAVRTSQKRCRRLQLVADRSAW